MLLRHAGVLSVAPFIYQDALSAQVVDANGDFYQASNNQALAFPSTQPFSFFGWFKPNSVLVNFGVFGIGTANNGGWEVFFSASLNKVRFVMSGTGGLLVIDTDLPIFAASTWTHFGFTYNASGDETGFTFYKDGVVTPATVVIAATVGDISNNAPFILGGKLTGRAFPGFDGVIGDQLYCNAEQSAAQVTTMYNGGIGVDPRTIPNIWASYLMGDAPGDSASKVCDVINASGPSVNSNLDAVGTPTFVADVP